MKYKIAAFFSGRNGLDELSRALTWTALLFLLVSGFIPVAWISRLLYWLSLTVLIYAYYRAFSKKLDQRQAENSAYLSRRNQLKQRWTQRKTHKFYRCPKCRAVLRVPKGKGKINITCRSCGEKFIRNT